MTVEQRIWTGVKHIPFSMGLPGFWMSTLLLALVVGLSVSVNETSRRPVFVRIGARPLPENE